MEQAIYQVDIKIPFSIQLPADNLDQALEQIRDFLKFNRIMFGDKLLDPQTCTAEAKLIRPALSSIITTAEVEAPRDNPRLIM